MVRRYSDSDKASVRHICAETAHKSLKSTAQKRKFLFLRYLDFYIEKCPDTCFVAETDGFVTGYVICCPDSVFFRKEFPIFVKNSGAKLFQTLLCLGDSLVYLPYKDKYPAHLHIDILPEAQRQGNGRCLINALCNELKNHGKSGVMLAVGKGNANAVNFYKATGFEIIRSLPQTYLMGKKL